MRQRLPGVQYGFQRIAAHCMPFRRCSGLAFSVQSLTYWPLNLGVAFSDGLVGPELKA